MKLSANLAEVFYVTSFIVIWGEIVILQTEAISKQNKFYL